MRPLDTDRFVRVGLATFRTRPMVRQRTQIVHALCAGQPAAPVHASNNTNQSDANQQARPADNTRPCDAPHCSPHAGWRSDRRWRSLLTGKCRCGFPHRPRDGESVRRDHQNQRDDRNDAVLNHEQPCPIFDRAAPQFALWFRHSGLLMGWQVRRAAGRS
jgi:hypothetical protein